MPIPNNVERLDGERSFELLVQAVKDYAIYLLDADGYVRSWNAGAERLKGYTAAEIIGKHFSCFYTPEDLAANLPSTALQRAFEEGKFEAEGWRVRKDGSRVWASVVIDPVYDQSGNFRGFAKITRDMTEKREAQQELDRAREALHHAQKMEAIGRLTGGVAHDFNNLLTVITTSVEFLRRQDLPAERRGRYLEAISGSANRAAKLTSQLLAFARQQPMKSEVFNVATKVAELQPIIETMLGSTVRVSFDLSSDNASVKTDVSQLETALINIAVNAGDAMPNGGSLAIAVKRVDGVPPVRGAAAVAGDYVMVTLRDSGSGISPDIIDRIFDPFFTTKEIGRGTGLGLSQVYGFVKQSGGEIEVETDFGVGTSFRIYLPAESTGEIHETNPQTAATTSSRRKRILLVEDNELVGSFSFDMLTDLNAEVTWTKDGASALEVLERRAHEFDCMFSDVMMPGMNGIELGKQVRQRWPTLQIVLTSGFNEVIATKDDHGFDMLPKPYSIADLARHLQLR